ncbi:MAG: hypothetical protein ACFFD4_14350 [Candidatus Odinarchaeota archaeon]
MQARESSTARTRGEISQVHDSSTDNFFLYSKDLNLVEINKTAMEFFPSMKKEELLGKNIVDIALGIKETGRYDLYREVMKTGHQFS